MEYFPWSGRHTSACSKHLIIPSPSLRALVGWRLSSSLCCILKTLTSLRSTSDSQSMDVSSDDGDQNGSLFANLIPHLSFIFFALAQIMIAVRRHILLFLLFHKLRFAKFCEMSANALHRQYVNRLVCITSHIFFCVAKAMTPTVHQSLHSLLIGMTSKFETG